MVSFVDVKCGVGGEGKVCGLVGLCGVVEVCEVGEIGGRCAIRGTWCRYGRWGRQGRGVGSVGVEAKEVGYAR